MRLLKWLIKTGETRLAEEPAGPPLPHPASFIGRSFELPREGIVTAIGYHIGGLRIGGSNRLRVQNIESGEICQITVGYLLANGTEVGVRSVEDIMFEDLDERVERIIGVHSLPRSPKENGEKQ